MTRAMVQAWIPARRANPKATRTPTTTPSTRCRPRDTDSHTVTWTVRSAASGANTGILLPSRSAAKNHDSPAARAVLPACSMG